MKPMIDAPCQIGTLRRSPQGERGLKLDQLVDCPAALGRSPQGERGVKLEVPSLMLAASHRRSPQGERGLKLDS